MSTLAYTAKATTAIALIACALAPSAGARWGGSRHSFAPYSDCTNPADKRDPIGVIFYGTAATQKVLGSSNGAFYVKGDIERHTGWGLESSPRYKYANSDVCAYNNTEVGSAGAGVSRFHVRLWEQKDSYDGGKHRTAGTPHYDTYENCDKHYVAPSPRYAMPYGGFGSGFDSAREVMRKRYIDSSTRRHHAIDDVYWGDNYPSAQCHGQYYSDSNGYVLLITVGNY